MPFAWFAAMFWATYDQVILGSGVVIFGSHRAIIVQLAVARPCVVPLACTPVGYVWFHACDELVCPSSGYRLLPF